MSMKIKKKNANVNAATNTANQVNNDYTEAVEYIQSAINALGTLAKDGDVIAKDSIVNLSVVLFDLKS